MITKKGNKKKKGSPIKSKSKQLNKRLNTFNSSQFSMLDDKNYASASVCDLFRNDMLRNRKNYNASVSSNRPPKRTTPKPAKNKTAKQFPLKNKKTNQQLIIKQSNSDSQIGKLNLKYHQNDPIKNRRANNASNVSNYQPTKKKQTKSKTTKQIKASTFQWKKIPEEPYEHIYLNPSNSQSQIAFSNQDTKRKDSNIKKLYLDDKPLMIDCHQEYKVKANKQQKKDESNRKEFINSMLRVSIKKQYQKKVEAAIKIQKVYRGYMTRKLLDKYVHQEELKLMQHLAQIQNIYSNRNQRRNLHLQDESNLQSSYDSNLRTFEDPQRSIQLSNRIPQQIDRNRRQINNHTFKVPNNQNQNGQQEEQSQSDEEVIAYRHQQPIYSHQQISKYLEQSESQQQDDQVYQPQIIFQTNEEYIQSRKSSLQNKNQPKNNLIHKIALNEEIKIERKSGHSQQLLPSANFIKNCYDKQPQESSYQPKIQQTTQQTEEIKKQNDKKFNVSFSKNQVIEYSLLKKIREVSGSSSSSSLNNKGQSQRDIKIIQLKQAEKQKWEQVIQMITQQVKKHQENNAEMLYFMNSIMQISKKNKEQLNQIDEFQRYTTPTTVDNKMESIQFEDHQSNIPQMPQHQQYKFQKKKNLQIQIIEENNPREQVCLKSKFKDSVNNSFKKDFLRKQLKSPNNEKEQMKNQVRIQRLELQQHQSLNNTKSISLKEKTAKLRSFLNQNIQDQSIQSMFKIREELLQKLESQTIMKLHNQLSKKQLTQQQFIEKLEQLTQKFQREKQSINKARNDIEKGYKAALGVVKQAYNDAKTLGIKVPLSRSLGNLKFKNSSALMFKNVIVDEFQCFTPKGNHQPFNSINYPLNLKSVRNNTKSLESESDSDVEFSEEQLNRFRKMQQYDSQFIEMNKNITIGEDFLKKHLNSQNNIQQSVSDEHHSDSQSDVHVEISSEAYRQRYEIQDAPIKENPQLDYLTNRQLDYLIYQCAIQLLVKPVLSERIMDRSHLSKPKKILKEQQILFIELLEQFLVDPYQLLQKLNQKISPLPFELLKCMRIDFSDSTEDNEFDNQYEEIGKYQFIISQDICAKALQIFKLKIEEINEAIQNTNVKKINPKVENYHDFESINQEYNFDDKIVKYIQQKERFIKQRRQHTKGLRWQVLNIEVHCIFDAWNQQLIQLRTKKPGFSGIGLNQLTLSTIDQNHPICIEEVQPMIEKGKKMLLEILNDQSDLIQKIQKQNFQEMCYTDSSWIYYADEALSYGLQLGYLVQQEIFAELVNEIANNFIINQSKSIIFEEEQQQQDNFAFKNQ